MEQGHIEQLEKAIADARSLVIHTLPSSDDVVLALASLDQFGVHTRRAIKSERLNAEARSWVAGLKRRASAESGA